MAKESLFITITFHRHSVNNVYVPTFGFAGGMVGADAPSEYMADTACLRGTSTSSAQIVRAPALRVKNVCGQASSRKHNAEIDHGRVSMATLETARDCTTTAVSGLRRLVPTASGDGAVSATHR